MRRTTLILFATLLVLTAIAVSAAPNDASDDTPSITWTPAAPALEVQRLEFQDGRRIFLRGPAVEGPTYCLAGSEDPRCSEVRAIVTSRPCTRPEDCQAYQQLLDITGEPETELLHGLLARPLDGRLPEPKIQKDGPDFEDR